MSPEETLEVVEKKQIEIIKQDKAYVCAYAIKTGKANGQYLYCLEDDKFYYYNQGYWETLFDVDFLGRIEENMKEITKFSIGRRKQIIDNFKQIARKHLSEFNWSELINMKNGMLNPYAGMIDPHDYTYYSTNRLPYLFDKEAKCELWVKTLSEILEGDQGKVNMLQEFFGYCLTRDTKQHKALLLLGESRSGKSTILQILRNVVGINNCSSVPIKCISNAQDTTRLMNKLVNIDMDVSAKASEYEAEFRTIVSGEPVQAKVLYVNSFDFVPYCKIVMAANIFPRITDHSSAFYNRLILIPCDRVFSHEEQNRELPSMLLKELSGILNWSIEGLKRLTQRGKFEEVSFMKEAIKTLEEENNPAYLFFDEHIEVEVGEGIYIEKPELYEKYLNWAKKNGAYPISNILFSAAVNKKYNKETPRDARLSSGLRPRIWRNLRYVEFKSNVIKTEVHWQDTESPALPKNQEIDWGAA